MVAIAATSFPVEHLYSEYQLLGYRLLRHPAHAQSFDASRVPPWIVMKTAVYSEQKSTTRLDGFIYQEYQRQVRIL